jgi:orotate phosphoribosyltransferase
MSDFPARAGHFVFESGHHGDLWLDLDALFADPARTDGLAANLADLLRPIPIDVVCGAMTGGALLGQVVARHLGCRFAWTERTVVDNRPRYVLPSGQREVVSGQRLALVDDVINAGSATGGTNRAVVSAGGIPVAIGALLVLGDAIDRAAAALNLPVIALERRTSNLWDQAECPLCAGNIPLERPGG